MLFDPATDPAAAQDGLRTVRGFVSLLNGALNDQSYANQDAFAYSPANQFTIQTPYGVGVEGLPIGTTRQGAVVISPMLVFIGIGVAAVLLFKRGR